MPLRESATRGLGCLAHTRTLLEKQAGPLLAAQAPGLPQPGLKPGQPPVAPVVQPAAQPASQLPAPGLPQTPSPPKLPAAPAAVPVPAKPSPGQISAVPQIPAAPRGTAYKYAPTFDEMYPTVPEDAARLAATGQLQPEALTALWNSDDRFQRVLSAALERVPAAEQDAVIQRVAQEHFGQQVRLFDAVGQQYARRGVTGLGPTAVPGMQEYIDTIGADFRNEDQAWNDYFRSRGTISSDEGSPWLRAREHWGQRRRLADTRTRAEYEGAQPLLQSHLLGTNPEVFDLKANRQQYQAAGLSHAEATRRAIRDKQVAMQDTDPAWKSVPKSMWHAGVQGVGETSGAVLMSPLAVAEAARTRSLDPLAGTAKDLIGIVRRPFEAATGYEMMPGTESLQKAWGEEGGSRTEAYRDPAAFAARLVDTKEQLQRYDLIRQKPGEWDRWVHQAQMQDRQAKLRGEPRPEIARAVDDMIAAVKMRESGQLAEYETLAQDAAQAGTLGRMYNRVRGATTSAVPQVAQFMGVGKGLTGGGKGGVLSGGGKHFGRLGRGGAPKGFANRGGELLKTVGRWTAAEPGFEAIQAVSDESGLGGLLRHGANKLRDATSQGPGRLPGEFGASMLENVPSAAAFLAPGAAAAKFGPAGKAVARAGKASLGLGAYEAVGTPGMQTLHEMGQPAPEGPIPPQPPFQWDTPAITQFSESSPEVQQVVEDAANIAPGIEFTQGAPGLDVPMRHPDGTPGNPDEIMAAMGPEDVKQIETAREQLLGDPQELGDTTEVLLTAHETGTSLETPEGARGLDNYEKQLGAEPGSLADTWNQMGPGTQVALSLGLGVGAIGLLLGLSGRGGILSWLFAILGLGTAAGAAAQGGMFGAGPQAALQGLTGPAGEPEELVPVDATKLDPALQARLQEATENFRKRVAGPAEPGWLDLAGKRKAQIRARDPAALKYAREQIRAAVVAEATKRKTPIPPEQLDMFVEAVLQGGLA